MRVVHVITSLADGGAQAVLARLVRADRRAEHSIVSLLDEGRYGPILRDSGIDVAVLGMRRRFVLPSDLVRLTRAIRSFEPDVVQTWMYHADLLGGLAARIAGIRRVVWGVHHTTLDRSATPRSTIAVARVNARLSGRVPSRIVCCAESARSAHERIGYASHRLRVVPNGIDVDRFRPDSIEGRRLRAAWGLGDDPPLLGMVARRAPQKDHETLLHAIAEARRHVGECATALVGRGVEHDASLRRRLATLDLGDTVRLEGARTDVPDVMNAFDVHVLSSRSEAFPNVLAEAMACGTPCVATDVGDAAEIVGDTGWIVPPGDPGALAGAIEEALRERRDGERWRLRCEAARTRIAERYSLATMVRGYHDVWNEA